MIVLDVNLLIYAYDTTCENHAKSRTWVQELFSGDAPVGLPWQTINAFLRIVTYPGLMGERFTMGQALAIVDQWVGMHHVRTLAPGDRHWALFREMITNGDARGKLTTDAALAALTIEYGGVLYSNDRDFARFPGLRWIDPLQQS